jgi:hypothetical protein
MMDDEINATAANDKQSPQPQHDRQPLVLMLLMALLEGEQQEEEEKAGLIHTMMGSKVA